MSNNNEPVQGQQQQPSIVKETEHAFATTPNIPHKQEDTEKLPQPAESTIKPEIDVDNIN